MKTETPQPKPGRVSGRFWPTRFHHYLHGRGLTLFHSGRRLPAASILFILLLPPLLCQPLFAQSSEDIRETVLQLRQLGDCRERVSELSRDNAALISLCDDLRERLEAVHQRELDLVRREKDLEIATVQARVRELEQTVSAWETRSREQDALIKQLTQRRQWWCLWVCKR